VPIGRTEVSPPRVGTPAGGGNVPAAAARAVARREDTAPHRYGLARLARALARVEPRTPLSEVRALARGAASPQPAVWAAVALAGATCLWPAWRRGRIAQVEGAVRRECG
jgi:hypothetical protein